VKTLAWRDDYLARKCERNGARLSRVAECCADCRCIMICRGISAGRPWADAPELPHPTNCFRCFCRSTSVALIGLQHITDVWSI